MKLRKLFASIALMTTLTIGVGFAVVGNNKTSYKAAEAAVSKTVTKVYAEDQLNKGFTLLAIESISFDESSGYGHSHWRDFLTSYLGTRSTYTTSQGTATPTKKGWSYMSNSEQEKYLLCPTGSINFTMVFPEWVTAFSYKIVGNYYYSWLGDGYHGSSAVGVHSSWGIGKLLNNYIYDSSGYKNDPHLNNTTQANTWGDITITARAIKDGTTTELANKSITMSKYYKMSGQSYDGIFGYNFVEWYTTNALTTEHNTLLTANATVYAKMTPKTEAYLSGTMNNWATADSTYLMEPGSDSQYVIHVTFAKDVEFKVVYQSSTWYGWSQVDQESKVVTNGSIIQGTDPDSTGYRIKVAVAGNYEIYLKTTASSNKLWIQQDSETEATTYATAFLATIDCKPAGGIDFEINEWNKVGEATTSMEYQFSQLTEGAKGKLQTAYANASGTLIEQCVARYDRILGKYGYGTASGQYHDFMERTPAPQASARLVYGQITNNNIAIIVVVVSMIGVASLGGYYFFKKRKHESD